MAKKNFVEELEWRGMIHTMMPGVKEQLEKEMTTAYLGIDPTADSLHIGHLVAHPTTLIPLLPFPRTVIQDGTIRLSTISLTMQTV